MPARRADGRGQPGTDRTANVDAFAAGVTPLLFVGKVRVLVVELDGECPEAGVGHLEAEAGLRAFASKASTGRGRFGAAGAR